MNPFSERAVSETPESFRGSSQTPQPTPEIARSFSIGSAAAGVLRAHTAALRLRVSMRDFFRRKLTQLRHNYAGTGGRGSVRRQLEGALHILYL